MITEPEVKFIRLTTGEDIIGNCLFDDEQDSLIIENPMKVALKRMSGVGQTMLVMVPWLPIELLNEDCATILYNNVITVIEPKPSFVEYYINTVIEYSTHIEIEDVDPSEDYIEDYSQEEVLEAYLESKKETLH